MRKLLGFVMIGLLATTILSCEEKAENPGDFNLKSELTFDPMQMISTVTGSAYDLKIAHQFDTAYMGSYTKNDTAFDEKGEPLIGPDGKLVIKVDTIRFRTGKTARYFEMDTVYFPAYADTFTFHLKGNALWKAPQYKPKKVQWLFNYNLKTGGTSLYGGGNSYFYLRTIRNKNKTRAEAAHQYIYTSDSTIMYHFVFLQRGEKD